ncbi:MAG TPA: L-fucokinase, partial [Lachnospiraceae bacterium]|nr:L-fucokinase [Lachnospiraceae bacterium]
MCKALLSCRKKIWEVLHDINLSLISLAPAEFIHFGTTHELLDLVDRQIGDYEFLDWKRAVSTNAGQVSYAVNNSLIMDSLIGEGCYMENACVKNAVVGEGSILSQIEAEGITVPAHVVMHGLKLSDGNFLVRIYGVSDNPKETLLNDVDFLGTKLSVMCERYQLREVLWDKQETAYLWTARLYPSAAGWKEACADALLIYRMAALKASDQEVDAWKNRERYSLETGYNAADVTDIVIWNHELENRILVEKYLTAIDSGTDAYTAIRIFGKVGITGKRLALLLDKAKEADFSTKIRIYYNLSLYLSQTERDFDDLTAELLEEKCFAEIRNTIYENAMKKIIYSAGREIRKDSVSVQLPVRVNWGGGWTDTPPHCVE